MDKSKFAAGQLYRLFPAPQRRSGAVGLADTFRVTSRAEKGLELQHVETSHPAFLSFDSVQEFREPDSLLVKGQFWLEGSTFEFTPLFDERALAAMAAKVGLGLYRVKHHEPATGAAKQEEDEIMGIISGVYSPESAAKLRRMLPVTKDKTNELQILLALVAWHKDGIDPDGQLELCQRGIKLTSSMGLETEEAVFRAHHATALMQLWVSIDLEGWGKVQASNRIGFPFITEDEQKAAVARLGKIEEKIQEEIAFAARVANKTGSIQLAGLTYSNALSAYGMRAMHLKGLNIDSWKNDKARVLRILADGKDHLVKVGSKVNLAYLYHNAANQMRYIGSRDEAIGMAEEAHRLAKEVKDVELERMSSLLIERISKTEK